MLHQTLNFKLDFSLLLHAAGANFLQSAQPDGWAAHQAFSAVCFSGSDAAVQVLHCQWQQAEPACFWVWSLCGGA